LGAAAAVKLLPLLLLPSLRNARALLAAALLAMALAAPYAGAGWRLGGSLGEYGRRWRGNDGAFALVHAAAEHAVARSRFAERQKLPPAWARALSGRDRDEVYPDEVANLLARLLAAALLIAALAWAWARGAPPERFAEVLFGGFVLLTPVLHPWYVLWLLPLIAVAAAPAWTLLALLTPLAYLPLASWLDGGAWHDATWTRVAIHGTTWLALAIDRRRLSAIIIESKKRSQWRG
jgi:hypothetical protein